MLKRKNNVVVMLIALATVLGGCSNAKGDTDTSTKPEIKQESKVVESRVKNNEKKDSNNQALNNQVKDNNIQLSEVKDNKVQSNDEVKDKTSISEVQSYTSNKKSTTQSKPTTSNKKSTTQSKPVTSNNKSVSSQAKKETISTSKNTAKKTSNPAPKQTSKTDSKPKMETTNNNVKSGNYEYLNAVEDEVLRLCNIEREKQGLAPLVMEEKLRGIARIKSVEMLENNFFDHNSPISGSPSNLMKINGYTNWTASGENIQMSQGRDKASVTASYIVEQWMNSPGHRANILNKEFKKIGVGIVFRSSDLKAYETQLFSN